MNIYKRKKKIQRAKLNYTKKKITNSKKVNILNPVKIYILYSVIGLLHYKFILHNLFVDYFFLIICLKFKHKITV